jgi:heme-degrading monooxygenase HmoA
MFVVLFEVQPRRPLWQEYLDTAALLRPELEGIEGFIGNERFSAARTEGRLLSLSTGRDEKSLIRWRIHAAHHDRGQKRGRAELFEHYRLRVAEVAADSQPPGGLPPREDRFDETETGDAKAIGLFEPRVGDEGELKALTETLAASDGIVDVERFDGILAPGRPLLLASWTDSEAAQAGVPSAREYRVRRLRVIRDYGMRERREAPQHFPDVR